MFVTAAAVVCAAGAVDGGAGAAAGAVGCAAAAGLDGGAGAAGGDDVGRGRALGCGFTTPSKIAACRFVIVHG